MQNNLEIFNGLWESFITALKGSLRLLANNGELTYQNATKVLDQHSACWKGDFDAEGRWLNALVDEDEAKGRLVRKILTMDMHFNEVNAPSGKITGLAIGAIGGGAVGYGVAALADMVPLGTAATVAAAAVIGGVVGRNSDVKSKHAAIEAEINEYASQLDAYYHSVIVALNA